MDKGNKWLPLLIVGSLVTVLALGLVALYEATFEERWIDQSVRLIELVQQHFADADAPGYFFTADDQDQLITRIKDMHEIVTCCEMRATTREAHG